ncbi:MAG: hypothetical protein LWX07_10955 [Bacteroidetes bacterium]|nr:hypothetical protein [Bacteroidota bacterium]
MDKHNKDNINNDLNGEPVSPEPLENKDESQGFGKNTGDNVINESHTENAGNPADNDAVHDDNTVSSEDLKKPEETADDSKPEQEKSVEETQETAKDENKTEKISAKEETIAAPAAETDTAGSVSDSNYQVSLIDENVLMVKVATVESVLVECSVKDKAMGKTSEEIQSNRIFIHPVAGEFKQEVEVLVTVGGQAKPEIESKPVEETAETNETPAAPETVPAEEQKPKISKETNYQVTLTDANILRIKIPTKKSVTIESSVKDTSGESESEEIQSNRIFIHPKSGTLRREVEIFIKIGVEETHGYSDAPRGREEKHEPKKSSGIKLTPNPIVADLIDKFREPKEEAIVINGRTPEEILEDRLGRKNPWRIYHRILERNLLRGAVAANVIAIIAAIIVFVITPKTVKEDETTEQKRLIVMQDLPENLNQQMQSIDDPNKPPETPKEDGTTGSDVTTPKITTPKIKAPRITVPKVNVKQDTSIANLNNELDSLRKKNISGNYTGKVNGTDTGKVNTSLMPDSLLKNLTENEVGLIGKFPPNWKQIDSRSININQKEFSGIILVDTTAKKKEEALNMSIQLDSKGDYWKQFQFKNVLEEDSLRTIYSLDPKIEAKLTYYRFYVASKIDNVFIAAYVEPSLFDKYKAEIEQVVKTIRISKPEKK